MTNSKRLFRNFFLLFSSNVLGQLLFFFGLVHLARVLGPSSFGVWNVAQAWMLYLLRAVDLGLEVVGIRSIVREPDHQGSVVWNVLGTRLVLAIILMCFVVVAAAVGIFPTPAVSLVVIFSLALFPVALILEWVFEAHQLVAIVSTARILKGLLFSLLIVYLILEPSQIQQAAFYFVASYSVASLVVFLAAMIKFKLGRPQVKPSTALIMFKEALPLGFSTLLSQYTMFIGTILLSYIASEESLGFYTAAHRLVIFLWAYGIVTSNRVLLPQLTKYFLDSGSAFSDFVKSVLRVLALISLPMAILSIVGARYVITLLYGMQYEQSIIPFQILVGALVLAIVRSVLEIGMIASNRQIMLLKGMSYLAIVYTIITFVFALKWGIIGAAWAALLGEGCFTLYIFVVFGNIGLSEILHVLWKPFAVGFAVAIVLVLCNFRSVLPLAFVGLFSYLLLLALTRQIKKTDVLLLFEAVGISSRITKIS